jgi:hypothetical protein
MVITAAGEVVVERDDFVTLCNETCAKMTPDEACTARHKDEFLVCHSRRII